MSRESPRKTSSSTTTRNLGMPTSNYSRKLQTSHHRTLNISSDKEDDSKGFLDKTGVHVNKPTRRDGANFSSVQPRKVERVRERNTGNLFMYRRKQFHNGYMAVDIDSRMNFSRLNVVDTLQISSFKEEDYRGRVILTSSENLTLQQHFLPGFKFADVNLRLNSAAINKLRLKEAFKTKDYGVAAKRVIEIRIPSMNGASGRNVVTRNKKPYFLYRHQNTPNIFK